MQLLLRFKIEVIYRVEYWSNIKKAVNNVTFDAPSKNIIENSKIALSKYTK